MNKTCIIIPCFNEARRLSVSVFVEFVKENFDIDLLFVNDGSTDKTAMVLDEICSQAPGRITCKRINQNKGKGEAVRTGMNEALKDKSYEFFAYFDADLATPLEEVKWLRKHLLENEKFDMSFGSRWSRIGSHIKRNIFRHYLGRIIATFISIRLGLAVYDTQCGAKLFARRIVADIFREPFASRWLFDVEIFARLINRYGKQEILKRMIEVPLNSWTEKANSSIPFSYIFKLPFELLKIK